jgi:hypothetical protein
MRSDPFRLKSRVRSFGSSDRPQNGKRAALRLNIEEIVPKEIEDRSPKEFGSVNLPVGIEQCDVSKLKPNVS